jgi:hypothetical protein
MSDNSTETGEISVSDALSLLSTPPVDNAAEEQPEAEAPQPQETETLEASEDTAQAPEDDYDDEDVDDGEDAYEEDDEDEGEEEQLYTVKIDGEEHAVTLDELQNGYSRQQAFTKRSMELAEQRKAFEAEQAQTQALRDAYKQQLDVLQSQIQQATQQDPDWRELAKTMPERELFLYKTEWDQQKEYLKQVEAEQQRIAAEQAQEQQAHMQQHLATQREDMLSRIPAWQNEETRNAERQEVIKYAQRRIGFSEEEIANASDARAIELLYKAWQWDNLQEKKPTAKKRTRKAPRMAKAGKPTTKRQAASKQRQQSFERLSKEGSVDAAVNYLMGR